MNRRQAKREACFAVASLLLAALQGGAPNNDGVDDPLSDADLKRLSNAMAEIWYELSRRGRGER